RERKTTRMSTPAPHLQPGSVGLVETKRYTLPGPFRTESGRTRGEVTVAYETYGRLNPAGDNAILIIHALTGDAHAAGYHSPRDHRRGWRDPLLGLRKALDTDKCFVVSSNSLGGCSGTTGPASIDPATGRPFGMRFPVVT